MKAEGIPKTVRAVLDQAPLWRGADLLEAMFERKTELPGRGRPSQTDLLAIVALANENAILAVEAKVDEPFGSLLADWLEGKSDELSEERSLEERERSKANRMARLEGLCRTFQVKAEGIGGLYYQLFHRTCAAIYEAHRFRYQRATMLVQSFGAPILASGLPAGFEEFRFFANAIGMPVQEPGLLSPPKDCSNVEIRLGWVSDQLSTS
jgi:hypothetical protein